MSALVCPICQSRWKIDTRNPKDRYVTCVPCEEKAAQRVHESDWIELEDMEAPKPVRGLNPEAAKRYGCKACGVSLGQAHLPDCSTGLGLGGSDAGESD